MFNERSTVMRRDRVPDEVRRIAAEASALETASIAITTGIGLEDARRAVATVARDWPTTDLASAVILKAMRGVTHDTLPVDLPRGPPPETLAQDVYHSTARAWNHWADGRGDLALKTIAALDRRRSRGMSAMGPALELLALGWWAEAVSTLAKGSTEDALRLWKKCLEVGGSLGMEALPVIQWTHLATLYHVRDSSKNSSGSTSPGLC